MYVPIDKDLIFEHGDKHSELDETDVVGDFFVSI